MAKEAAVQKIGEKYTMPSRYFELSAPVLRQMAPIKSYK
jgi:hypothetical protein